MDNSIDIKHFLPHQLPMLMVDKFIDIDDQQVETIFEIKESNIFVKNSEFVEVGLVENAAQTCSSIVAQSYFLDENKKEKNNVKVIGFISAIKTIKIHSLPKVGQTITTKANLITKFITDDYSLCTLNCKTYTNQELLLEGEINLFIQEKR